VSAPTTSAISAPVRGPAPNTSAMSSFAATNSSCVVTKPSSRRINSHDRVALVSFIEGRVKRQAPRFASRFGRRARRWRRDLAFVTQIVPSGHFQVT
jgi:hypothetical protein